jgi:hypothetical protein
MALDLFVGIPVTDYTTALPGYERFFGGKPTAFLPNDTGACGRLPYTGSSASCGIRNGRGTPW